MAGGGLVRVVLGRDPGPVAGTLTDEVTFLGAHVVPPELADDPDAYVALVTGPMLDACAPLARWIDVFVEDGAFGEDAARTILTAGRERGLGREGGGREREHARGGAEGLGGADEANGGAHGEVGHAEGGRAEDVKQGGSGSSAR